MKKAFITGITGQDGSYLTEFLLTKGYEVHGLIRRSSSFNTGRIDHLYQDPHISGVKLFLHYGDLADASRLCQLLHQLQPDEIYHLGAQSHVRVSFDSPEYTGDINAIGTLRMLEAVRNSGVNAKFYQSSSSEMFGKVCETPQKESTPFYPRSPYGCSKLYAHWSCTNYREAYGMHISNGILFNHESPRRGETFVTRKITRGIARILAGKQECIYLGNLDARRDWGFAGDYVQAMWLMLQAEHGDDYVIATNQTHSVRDFLSLAFKIVGRNWQDYIQIDPKYYRPTEVDLLQGDYSKANQLLGWKPTTSFSQLVHLMLTADIILEGLDPQKWISHETSQPLWN